ncbi:ANF protein, partial [Ciccaba nigrolineata]|nr:ANF protein [Ciccaba nigrolineata]
MRLPVLCCGASLLLLVLPWAGAQPAGGEHGAELPVPPAPPPLSFPLQDLLEALGQLREEEGEPGPEDELVAGAEDGGSEWDLPGAESGPAGAPLPAPSPPQPAEGQSQWRSLLSAYRRRHFSGCFGMRMERIGAQTGLGCNQYKARRSRVR